MATSAVDSSSCLCADYIPIVDLRFFSQSELNSLSLCSADAFDTRRTDDLVIPKIDRTLFNESAGSRKQTYARPRLASRPSNGSSVGHHRNRLIPESTTSSSSDPVHDIEKIENKRIVQFLRDLFNRQDSRPSTANTGNATEEQAADIIQNAATSTAIVVYNDRFNRVSNQGNADILNRRGAVIDLESLANTEYLFVEELRRRTSSLVTEAQLLDYMRGLNGTWGSRRKKRKIVDADEFGDNLPRGWKVLLGLRRKEGRVWLYCRRFISPNGQQFTSCKEVASYLRSLVRTQDETKPVTFHVDETSHCIPQGDEGSASAGPQNVDNITREVPICYAAVPISSVAANPGQQVVLFRVENPAKAQLRNLLECRKCNVSFGDKDSYVQHLLSVHHRNAKRTRLGKSVGDGVIMNGGKYECQFCHKIFEERRRYNGHVGIHVRNYVKSLEEIPDEIIVQTSIDPSVMTVVPPLSMRQMDEAGQPLCGPCDKGSCEQECSAAKLSTDVHGDPGVRDTRGAVALKCSSVEATSENSVSKSVEAGNDDIVAGLTCSTVDGCHLHAANEEDYYELAEDEPKVAVKAVSSSMEMDSGPSLNPSLPLINGGTNKEIASSKASDGSLNNSIDMVPRPRLNDLTQLPDSEEKCEDSTDDKMRGMTIVSSDYTKQDAFQSLNVATLFSHNEKKVPEDSLKNFSEVNEVDEEVSAESDEVQHCGSEHWEDRTHLKGSVLTMSDELRNKMEESSRSCSISLYEKGQVGVLGVETCTDDSSDGKMEKADLEGMGGFDGEVGLDLGISYYGSTNAEVGISGHRNEENLLKSLMADTALQSSDCFLSNRGEDAFGNGNQKLESMSGFDELRFEDLGLAKFSYATSQRSNSLPEPTLVLACGSELGHTLDTSVQFEWDTDLPKMVSSQQLTAVCVWCRVEFNQEGADADAQSDSVGFMCPNCKARISGQLNILENTLSL